jgi:hypothetical protein
VDVAGEGEPPSGRSEGNVHIAPSGQEIVLECSLQACVHTFRYAGRRVKHVWGESGGDSDGMRGWGGVLH